MTIIRNRKGSPILKNSVKKLFCSVLCVILAFFCVQTAFAAEPGGEKDVLIMVSGFGATTLVETDKSGNEEVVFPPDGKRIEKVLKENIKNINGKKAVDCLADVVSDILEPIRMTEGGKSVYSVEPIYESAKETSYEAFEKNNALSYIPYTGSEFLDMKSAAEKLGSDRVFNFLYDWRLSGDEIADKLLKYIEEVRALTECEKVNVYCLSQGSVAVSQYLYKYSEKGYIRRLVFDNPIFEGSDFVSDLFGGKDGTYSIKFNTVFDLLENILHLELDISGIAAKIPNTDPSSVNKFLKKAADSVILPKVKNAPAFLEMVPENMYKTVIERYFASAENEPLIAEAEKARNGYMKDVSGTLKKAQENGTSVSIVSCTGSILATGTDVCSDAIVNLSLSCGACCSENADGFPASYVQKKAGVYSISPDRTVDLSCGYLPERTWIINERYHGQVEWAPISLALVEKLLYTDELTDAYSSFEFPQFLQSDDPGRDVYCAFTSTNSLLTKTGTNGNFVVKNTSKKFPVLLKNVSIENEALLLSAELPLILKPGESAVFGLDASKEKSSKINVAYFAGDSADPKEKSFSFTVSGEYPGVVLEKEERPFSENIVMRFFAKIWDFVTRAFEYIGKIISAA